MRILHITNNFPTLNFPIFGIFIKEQIESLRSLGNENEVFFINSREEGKIAYLKSLGRLRRHLKQNSYDIIHCHHSYSGVTFLLSGQWPNTRRLLSYQSDPRNEGGILLLTFYIGSLIKLYSRTDPRRTNLSKTVYLPNEVNTRFFAAHGQV